MTQMGIAELREPPDLPPSPRRLSPRRSNLTPEKGGKNATELGEVATLSRSVDDTARAESTSLPRAQTTSSQVGGTPGAGGDDEDPVETDQLRCQFSPPVVGSTQFARTAVSESGDRPNRDALSALSAAGREPRRNAGTRIRDTVRTISRSKSFDGVAAPMTEREQTLVSARLAYRRKKKQLQNALKRAEMYHDYRRAEKLQSEVSKMQVDCTHGRNGTVDNEILDFYDKQQRNQEQEKQMAENEAGAAAAVRERKRRASHIREAEIKGLEEALSEYTRRHEYKRAELTFRKLQR